MRLVDPVVVPAAAAIGAAALAPAPPLLDQVGVDPAVSGLAVVVWAATVAAATGAAAGWFRPHHPLRHGATAAVLAVTAVMVVAAGTGTADGFDPTAVVSLVATAAALGATGGLAAEWIRRRRRWGGAPT